MVFKTGKLIVINKNGIQSRKIQDVQHNLIYNGEIYTVREFSKLIGSNMGWLQL